ncbi:HPr family phosphocarrier protein [Guptibacillus algicola]|uniref:HPr family phosphocarrier protein n=1 Tax=Guptibacillus algicola TaxID=225844 RepID=UPI001CD6778C|nr:HPr family phosphocarrier protein [Alkalihalobacillus algicola]MCA0988786.1 HPr family phosphocarrier protein [Alkalihalobacillus algicola]
MMKTTKLTVHKQHSMNALISFVKQAKSFDSHITLYHDGHSINGKSLTSVIAFNLMVSEADTILLIAEGPDAENATETLSELLESEQSATDQPLSFM